MALWKERFYIAKTLKSAIGYLFLTEKPTKEREEALQIEKIYTVSRGSMHGAEAWGCSCLAWTRRRLICKHIKLAMVYYTKGVHGEDFCGVVGGHIDGGHEVETYEEATPQPVSASGKGAEGSALSVIRGFAKWL
jgi:hypothetical protein